ncbi:MAG: PucR family transcriptional regulator [Mycobacteriales bacterium]
MGEATSEDRDWQPVREAAHRVAQDLEEHAFTLSTLLHEQIPAYAVVAVVDLVPGVAASITAGMAALEGRRRATEAELKEVRWVAESRARQGMPLAALLEAYHIGARTIWEVVRADVTRGRVRPGVILEATQLLWQWADTVTVHAASAHQHASMDIVRHDQQRRTEFLRALLFGSAGPGELLARAAVYRLAPDRPYLPFQAELGPGTQLQEFERLIGVAGSTADQPAMVGLIEGCLAGVVSKVPDLRGYPVTLVAGPATDLTGVPASFQLACRGLHAAVGFDLPGVHRVEDLALLVAVASEDFLGSCLVRRYLEPLRSLRGSAVEVEQTLGDFFRAGMRVDEAARAGFVHPNTVRHRLHRFEEVTGADLRRTEDLVGAWWALQKRKLTD